MLDLLVLGDDGDEIVAGGMGGYDVGGSQLSCRRRWNTYIHNWFRLLFLSLRLQLYRFQCRNSEIIGFVMFSLKSIINDTYFRAESDDKNINHSSIEWATF